MADKVKPHTVERVKKIREWEEKNNFKEAKDIEVFKPYHNYYVPEKLVLKSKSVLSFGVGGNANFEKLLAADNLNLKVELFDPTPSSIWTIRKIIRASKRKVINAQSTQKEDRNLAVSARLNFNPIAYGKQCGTLPFYYDPDREGPDVQLKDLKQSFSLVPRQPHFPSVDVKVQNLEKIMDSKGLKSVDILKADIEGLWYDFGNEIIEKKIDCKFLAMELELNFEKDEMVEPALDKAQEICDKFANNNYDVVINRRREKLMLEMLYIRKDAYEG